MEFVVYMIHACANAWQMTQGRFIRNCKLQGVSMNILFLIMRFFILREADIWSTMLKTILEYEG